MLLRWLLVIGLAGFVLSRKHHHSSEEEEESDQPTGIESKGKEIVDRMMVNMAGAVVKSIFPEMDKLEKKAEVAKIQTNSAPSGDIRRAPYPSQYGVGSMDEYDLSSPRQGEATLEGAGLGGPGNSLGALGNPQMSALAGAVAPLFGGGSGTGSGMDSRMVNELRNQRYLAELAKHQHELNTYSAKQMEYLDQRKRYEQALIDHQAEASLQMQQEQQRNLNEQIAQSQAMYAKQRSLMAARAAAHGSRTHVPQEAKKTTKPGDRSLTSDADLISYLKQEYNIPIEDGSPLSDDERETLRMLKIELAIKKSKEEANGKTINNLDEKTYSRVHSPSKTSHTVSDLCEQCIPLSIRKLKGAWTQVYGNPETIKRTFGTILSLERMNATGNTRMSTTLRNKKPTCVGMEIGSYNHGEAELNLFFREDSEGHLLHEMKGEVIKQDGKNMMLETDFYSTEMCIVRAGPVESDRPEYIVLAETKGENACSSLHVFARSTEEFNRRHFDDVSDFMRKQVTGHNALPVGAFPMAEVCQLNQQ